MSWALEKFESNLRYTTSCFTPKSNYASDMKSLTYRSSNLHSEEEEITFMRSLGWEGNSEFNDDNYEGLTLQEISDFYEKVWNCFFFT